MEQSRPKKARVNISPVLKPALQTQHFNAQQMTLMIIGGDVTLIKLERALEEVALHNTEDLAEVGVAARKLQLRIIPTLNPEMSSKTLIPAQVDYVIIMLDPSDPTALDQAEYETSFIEKSFLARDRVGFCFWQRSDTVYQFVPQKLREFCKKFFTTFDSIRFDDDDSVQYNARLLYNRLQRLATNPVQS